MKRIMRKAVIFTLCVSLIIGCAAVGRAALAPLKIGDANTDGSITISDATEIQRRLAGLSAGVERYTQELQDALCDADGDGKVTIVDATAIQRMLANLPSDFVEDDIWDYYVGDAAFHSDVELMSYNSELQWMSREEACYVGAPVTFTAEVKWGAKPRSFSLVIEGVTVEEVQADGEWSHAFSYTFENAGEYEVQTHVDCKYGVGTGDTRKVVVRDLPAGGGPMIIGAAFYDMSRMNSGNGELTVNAIGGTQPYEYSYQIYTAQDIDTEYVDGIPQPGKATVWTGWIKENTVNPIEVYSEIDDVYRGMSWMPELYVRITVRDAEGRESQPVTAVYQDYALVA